MPGVVGSGVMQDTATDWTVEKLVSFAQSMDNAREIDMLHERIRHRKLAFGARKWARTKVNNEH